MDQQIKMPQMGESIYEGTVTKWLKKPGDFVKRDEPLYEISTDKVDTEIPSPIEGVLKEIVVQVGKKVPIHTVVAVIDDAGKTGTASPTPAPAPKEAPRPAPQPVAQPVAAGGDDGGRVFSSPLVRRIAKEEGVRLEEVHGSGWKGRITKQDVMSHLEKRQKVTTGSDMTVRVDRPVAPPPRPVVAPPPVSAPPRPAFAGRTEVVPMSAMRSKIAEHMVMSRRTSAHVTTVFEVDLSRVWALREKEKTDFETVTGTKLTFTPFFAAAAMEGIKEFPIINSSVDGNNIVYKRDINLGIAVALPEGLIVPVVKNAEEKSFLGLCRGINDLAERARTKKLTLDEVQGGTFTITNPGIYGGLFGTPIINQPQVAIMGIGGIEKRPVVIDDAIGVRPMCYIVLSFDHRVIDGAVADQFMARVKGVLQSWNLPIR